MNKYKCELLEIKDHGDHFRATVRISDDHKVLHDAKGHVISTSKIRMIDFERKFLVTQNSIYTWEH